MRKPNEPSYPLRNTNVARASRYHASDIGAARQAGNGPLTIRRVFDGVLCGLEGFVASLPDYRDVRLIRKRGGRLEIGLVGSPDAWAFDRAACHESNCRVTRKMALFFSTYLASRFSHFVVALTESRGGRKCGSSLEPDINELHGIIVQNINDACTTVSCLASYAKVASAGTSTGTSTGRASLVRYLVTNGGDAKAASTEVAAIERRLVMLGARRSSGGLLASRAGTGPSFRWSIDLRRTTKKLLDMAAVVMGTCMISASAERSDAAQKRMLAVAAAELSDILDGRL